MVPLAPRTVANCFYKLKFCGYDMVQKGEISEHATSY